jgi:hypothetical protein
MIFSASLLRLWFIKVGHQVVSDLNFGTRLWAFQESTDIVFLTRPISSLYIVSITAKVDKSIAIVKYLWFLNFGNQIVPDS